MFWILVRDFLKSGGAATAMAGFGGLFGPDVNTALGAVGAIATAAGTLWGVYVRWNTVAVPAATGARSDVATVSAATGVVEPATRKR